MSGQFLIGRTRVEDPSVQSFQTVRYPGACIEKSRFSIASIDERERVGPCSAVKTFMGRNAFRRFLSGLYVILEIPCVWIQF
jgi:hypothetical protein